jgi:CubicO group peptidase (beta-lactamase class C family)
MYANIGFDLISYLIELLSGESFLDYCDTHIFIPLEMNTTSFNLSRLDIDQVAIPLPTILRSLPSNQRYLIV